MEQRDMQQMNVGRELSALERLTVKQLRERYAEVFGETSSSRHKDFLIKRIIWRVQALAHGGLSDRARARAACNLPRRDRSMIFARSYSATTP